MAKKSNISRFIGKRCRIKITAEGFVEGFVLRVIEEPGFVYYYEIEASGERFFLNAGDIESVKIISGKLAEVKSNVVKLKK